MIEKEYKVAYANGITPNGTLEITENGNYDISNYVNVNVNVNVMPIEITENDDGTVDLTIVENTTVSVVENEDGTVDITIPTE